MKSIDVFFTITFGVDFSVDIFYKLDDAKKYISWYTSGFPFHHIDLYSTKVFPDCWHHCNEEERFRICLRDYLDRNCDFIDSKNKSFEDCLCDDLDDDVDQEEELVFFTEDEVEK